MRSLCLRLAGSVLACTLLCLAPGCDGSSGLEKTPEVKQASPPDMSKMPGYNEMQEKMKTQGKAAKK